MTRGLLHIDGNGFYANDVLLRLKSQEVYSRPQASYGGVFPIAFFMNAMDIFLSIQAQG